MLLEAAFGLTVQRGALTFRTLEPDDLLTIERQDSQALWLGTPGDVTDEAAAGLAGEPVAWTAFRPDGSVLACFGIAETFAGVQGVAWAMLSQPIGRHHLALTRFIRDVVQAAPYQRLELLAKAREIEAVVEVGRAHGFTPMPAALVNVAMADPTPECRWAELLGFTAVHVLRKFGAASETYMLFERIA